MAEQPLAIDLFVKDSATGELRAFRATLKKTGKATEDAFKRGKKGGDDFTKSLKKVAIQLGLTTGAVFAFRAATRTLRQGVQGFLSYDEALTRVRTILDENVVSIEEVDKRIRSLSVAFGEQEELVAGGFYQTLSAGVTDASKAFILLEGALELSTAGFTDSEQAVDLLTNAINAYGFEVNALVVGDLNDLIFKTTELGKTTVPELASSLGRILPIAAGFNVKLEEVLAATGALTLGAQSTAEALTGMRGIFIGLLQAQDKLSRGTITVATDISLLRLRTDGLVPILADLRREFAGNTEGLQKIFPEVEAFNAVAALTGPQFENLNRILGEFDNKLGASGKALAKVTDSDFFQAEQASVRLGQSVDKLGESFFGAFTTGQEEGGKMADTVDGLAVAIEAFTPAAVGAAGAILQIAASMAAFRSLTQENDTEIGKLKESLFSLQASLLDLRATQSIAESLGIDRIDPEGDARKLNILQSAISGISIEIATLEGRVDPLELIPPSTVESVEETIREIGEVFSSGNSTITELHGDIVRQIKLAAEQGLSIDPAVVVAELEKAGSDPSVISNIEGFMQRVLAPAQQAAAEAGLEAGKQFAEGVGEGAVAAALSSGEIQTAFEGATRAVDETADAVTRVKTESERLREIYNGDDFFAGFGASLKENSDGLSQFGQLGAASADLMVSALGGLPAAFARGEQSGKDFVKNLGADIAGLIAQLFILRALASAFGSASTPNPGVIDQSFAGVGTNNAAGGALVPAFEQGGVANRGMSSNLPIHSYASGGVATDPQIGIFGEGANPFGEAFVPLGPSRRIPVEISGGGGGAGGGQSINVELHVTSLDPRTAADVVMAQWPAMRDRIASSLVTGESRKLSQSIRGTL